MYNIKLDDIDIVVFDFDCVIAKTNNAFQIAYKHLFGYPKGQIEFGKVRKWNYTDVIPQITERQCCTVFSSELLFDVMRLYDDIVESMKWFRQQGKKVVILTLGDTVNLHNKSKFIHENLHGLYDYIILAGSDKDLVMDKSIFTFGDRSVIVDDNELNLYSSPCGYKILAKLYTDEPMEHNSTWKGLSIRSGNELINLFR